MIEDIDHSTPTSREQLFLLYANFAGDFERTAYAAGITPVQVIDAAKAGGWDDKLRAIIALRKSAAPGDLERGINRSLAFVQAHRMRLFIDRVLLRLSLMENEELEEYLFSGPADKQGNRAKQLSTRSLADLASAMEKVTAIANQALCDTAQDRSRRDEETGGGEASGALHVQIAAAMAAIGADKTPAALLLDAQLANAVSSVKQLTPAPYEDG